MYSTVIKHLMIYLDTMQLVMQSTVKLNTISEHMIVFIQLSIYNVLIIILYGHNNYCCVISV